MQKEDFEPKSFNLNNLKGRALTYYDGSTNALSQNEIIARACTKQTNRMPGQYGVKPNEDIVEEDRSDPSKIKLNFGFDLTLG